MSPSDDRRVRRTRAALQEALLDLLGEQTYESITVQQLIDRADIGRSTFYAHYTDKRDLLEDGLAGLREMLDGPVGPAGSGPWRFRFSGAFLAHVEYQDRLARAVFSADGAGSALLQAIRAMITDAVGSELTAPGGPAPVALPLDTVVATVTGAFLGFAEWWLLESPRAAAADADRLFQAIVLPAVRAAARPATT